MQSIQCASVPVYIYCGTVAAPVAHWHSRGASSVCLAVEGDTLEGGRLLVLLLGGGEWDSDWTGEGGVMGEGGVRREE